jgi:hypothetical protein
MALHMIILCDTSSIFLLLRIAPDMFTDPTYDCATLPDIFNETFRTQKFKEKYPWRTNFKSKVKPLPYSRYSNQAFYETHKTIKLLLDTGVIDNETGDLFKLSPEDCAIVSCAIVHDFEISSGDRGLVAFARQEFPAMFKGNLCALEVINRWLVNNAITWDNTKHGVLADWKLKKEAPQPRPAIQQFRKLTRRDYPGP